MNKLNEVKFNDIFKYNRSFKKENYLFDLFFQLYEWVFVRDSVMILYDVVG